MKIAEQKQALLARRKALTGHLSDIEESLEEMPSKDWDDRSTERQGDEVLESLGQVELAELRRIDAALNRIEKGTYGTCQKCGEQISDKCLALLPDTPFCKNCAL